MPQLILCKFTSRPMKTKRVPLKPRRFFEMFKRASPCQGAASVWLFPCQILQSSLSALLQLDWHPRRLDGCDALNASQQRRSAELRSGRLEEGLLRRSVQILCLIPPVQTMSALLWPEHLWWECLWPSLLFPWPKSSWASLWHYILMHTSTCRGLGDPLRLPSLPHQACPDVAVCTWMWGHTHYVLWFLFFFRTSQSRIMIFYFTRML